MGRANGACGADSRPPHVLRHLGAPVTVLLGALPAAGSLVLSLGRKRTETIRFVTAAVGCVRPRVRYSTEFRRPNLQGKRPVFFCFAKVLIGTLSQAVCRLQFWLFQDIVLVLRVAFWKLKLCAAGDGDLYSSTCHRVLTSCSSNPGRGLRRAPRLRNLSWVSGVRQRPRSRTRLPQSQPAALDHTGKHPAPVLFPRARKPVYVPGSASHTVSVASTQLCPWWIKAARTTRKQKVTFQKTFFTEK